MARSDDFEELKRNATCLHRVTVPTRFDRAEIYRKISRMAVDKRKDGGFSRIVCFDAALTSTHIGTEERRDDRLADIVRKPG